MKMIAQHTIHAGSVLVRKASADEMRAGRRDKYQQTVHQPGHLFEVADEAAADLLRTGAARIATAEEMANRRQASAAMPTAASPASGATRAPDPNQVADRSMAGEVLDQFREERQTEEGAAGDEGGDGDEKKRRARSSSK
jgi:hypothetical protein